MPIPGDGRGDRSGPAANGRRRTIGRLGLAAWATVRRSCASTPGTITGVRWPAR